MKKKIRYTTFQLILYCSAAMLIAIGVDDLLYRYTSACLAPAWWCIIAIMTSTAFIIAHQFLVRMNAREKKDKNEEE